MAVKIGGFVSFVIFIFSFIPRSKALKNSFKTTIIFYESPFRLLKTLESIMAIFGDIDIVVARELTKMHEEVRREKVSVSIKHFAKTAPKAAPTSVVTNLPCAKKVGEKE